MGSYQDHGQRVGPGDPRLEACSMCSHHVSSEIEHRRSWILDLGLGVRYRSPIRTGLAGPARRLSETASATRYILAAQTISEAGPHACTGHSRGLPAQL